MLNKSSSRATPRVDASLMFTSRDDAYAHLLVQKLTKENGQLNLDVEKLQSNQDKLMELLDKLK